MESPWWPQTRLQDGNRARNLATDSLEYIALEDEDGTCEVPSP